MDIGPGHAYQDKELENEFNIKKGVKVWGEAEEDKGNEDNNIRISASQSDTEKNSKKHKKDKKKSEKAKKSHSSRKGPTQDKPSKSMRDRSSESFMLPPAQPPVSTSFSSSSSNSITFPSSDEGNNNNTMMHTYIILKLYSNLCSPFLVISAYLLMERSTRSNCCLRPCHCEEVCRCY